MAGGKRGLGAICRSTLTVTELLFAKARLIRCDGPGLRWCSGNAAQPFFREAEEEEEGKDQLKAEICLREEGARLWLLV